MGTDKAAKAKTGVLKAKLLQADEDNILKSTRRIPT